MADALVMQKPVRASPRGDLVTEIVLVTPELAKAWLDQNTSNRRLSERDVQKYARDMKAGKWRLTGDAIRFDKSNTLLDGQHRLHAIVRADVPVATMVIYNVDNSARDVMDTGKARSAADVLALSGRFQAARLSSAARALLSYSHSDMGGRRSFTTSEVLSVVDKNPLLSKCIGQSHKMPRGLPYAAIDVLSYLSRIVLQEEEKADAMLGVLRTGIPSYDGCPIHQYREKMITAHTSGSQRLRPGVSAHLLFASWNRFATGAQAVGTFRWPTEFVAIKGVPPASILT